MSDTTVENKNTDLQRVKVLGFEILTLIIGTGLRTLTFMLCWNWFITSATQAQPIGPVLAFGLALTAGLVQKINIKKFVKDQEEEEKQRLSGIYFDLLVKRFKHTIGLYSVVLATGYITQSFL